MRGDWQQRGGDMDGFDVRLFAQAGYELEREVSLALKRSDPNFGGCLAATSDLSGNSQFELSSDAVDPDYEHVESSSWQDWVEVQLLDCQLLARQHGRLDLVSLFDQALDQLAGVAERSWAAS